MTIVVGVASAKIISIIKNKILLQYIIKTILKIDGFLYLAIDKF